MKRIIITAFLIAFLGCACDPTYVLVPDGQVPQQPDYRDTEEKDVWC